MTFLKRLSWLSFIAFITGITWYTHRVRAEQGDYATLGYDMPNARSYWRVNSSGLFIPGVDNTLDVGTANKYVRTLYIGTSIVSSGTVTQSGAATFNGNVTVGDAQADTLIIKAGSATVTTANLYISSATSSVSPILFLDAVNSRVGVMDATPSTALDVTGTIRASVGLTAAAGPVALYSRTLAQINAITPGAAGEGYYCSNCIDSAVCISSGTGVGAFVQISSATVHCN